MVYVDILVIEDLIINYIILVGTGILLNRIMKFRKIFLSSVMGTIPLIFLFMDINMIFMNVIIIFFAFLMVIISFGYKDIIYTIKNIIYMYFISIFLAGSIYFININIFPKSNSYILNVFILLTICPIITYFWIKNISNIKINNSNYYKIDIYFKDKPKITVNSFLDTGNKLIDPYTFKPIILISKSKIKLTGEKIILIPYNTIDNHGLLECFSPRKIYIYNVGYRKRLLIGIINEISIDGVDCIMNSKLLERI